MQMTLTSSSWNFKGCECGHANTQHFFQDLYEGPADDVDSGKYVKYRYCKYKVCDCRTAIKSEPTTGEITGCTPKERRGCFS